MTIFRIILLCVLALPFSAPSQAASDDKIVGIAGKALLQASMQTFIDGRLVYGAFLTVGRDDGKIRKLFPSSAHPMIFRQGKFFVLCSDFRDEKGKSVNVDFYLAQRGKSYVVFDTVVDDRVALKRLMKAGLVKRLN